MKHESARIPTTGVKFSEELKVREAMHINV
jgi:hypothetical protein